MAHLVEDAAVEPTAGAVADEPVKRARRIDFLGRGSGRGSPRQTRPVNHREAVLQTQFIGLDTEHEARDSRAAAEVCGEHLIHRGADADLAGIEADGRAGQHVHPAEVRAGGGESGLTVESLHEHDVLAMRQQRGGGGPKFHRGAGTLGPPVNRLHAV